MSATMVRLIIWAVLVAVIEGAILGILAWILPGFSANDFGSLVISGAILILVLTVSWPAIIFIARAFPPILFPLISFLASGALTLLTIRLVNHFDSDALTIDNIWTAIVVVVGVTIGNTLVFALSSLDDERSYEWFVIRPLRVGYRNTPKSDVPGFLFLEIDGLAEPILQQALEQGFMPTLKRWLDTSTHVIRQWEPDLSSQTSASQAGILLGSNDAIPAFRWWDKATGQLMVSSKMSTARDLESRLSNGDGLLVDGGGSRWNVFSGDASDNLGTFSKIGVSNGNGQRSYFAYFANPYTLARTLGLFIAEIVRERYQARYQRVHDVQPRIDRTWKYAVVRAGTTVFLQETSQFMLIADMFRGMPSVYNTFFSYDEVAHHSGIDRADGYKVLRRLDRVFAQLEGVAREAPRPYNLIVLSDHGQSQGATFKQRYGMTLGELVDSLTSDDLRVGRTSTTDEGLTNVSAALTEAMKQDTRTAQLARRAFKSSVHDGQVDLEGPQGEGAGADQLEPESHDAVVLASGNLGLISFTKYPTRLSYEELVDRFPDLLPGLVHHDGVSFILVHSETDGGIVIGKSGIRYLEHDYFVGEDPLADFGEHVPDHLRRTDGFPTSPDILVMSRFDPSTGEVAAFEELVGCHGGVGGPQTQPFVLFPQSLESDDGQQIIGAGSLHNVLKSWVKKAQAEPTTDSVSSMPEESETARAPARETTDVSGTAAKEIDVQVEP
jgi:putative membrane protein